MEDFDQEESIKDKREQQKRNMLSVVVVTVIITGIIIAYLCFSGSLFGSGDNAKALEVTNTSMSTTYLDYSGRYSTKINGTINNQSGKNYSLVMVEFSVYDGAGNNLGTARASISNLFSGDTWQFSASLSLSNTKPTSYKLVSITAY